MSEDDADSLVLRHLRRIDTKVDRLIDDMRDIKPRMTTVEESVAGQSRRLETVSRAGWIALSGGSTSWMPDC